MACGAPQSQPSLRFAPFSPPLRHEARSWGLTNRSSGPVVRTQQRWDLVALLGAAHRPLNSGVRRCVEKLTSSPRGLRLGSRQAGERSEFLLAAFAHPGGRRHELVASSSQGDRSGRLRLRFDGDHATLRGRRHDHTAPCFLAAGRLAFGSVRRLRHSTVWFGLAFELAGFDSLLGLTHRSSGHRGRSRRKLTARGPVPLNSRVSPLTHNHTVPTANDHSIASNRQFLQILRTIRGCYCSGERPLVRVKGS